MAVGSHKACGWVASLAWDLPSIRLAALLYGCKGLQDEVIGAARAHPDSDVFEVSRGLKEQAAEDLMAVDVDEGTGGPTGDDVETDTAAGAAEALAQTVNPDRDLHSFEIIPDKVCCRVLPVETSIAVACPSQRCCSYGTGRQSLTGLCQLLETVPGKAPTPVSHLHVSSACGYDLKRVGVPGMADCPCPGSATRLW